MLTFVTELSTPVSVTEALPGFIAGPVYTARVRDAFITVQTLPAIQTPERDKYSLKLGFINAKLPLYTATVTKCQNIHIPAVHLLHCLCKM